MVKLKLGPRFAILLSVVLVVGILTSAAILWGVLERRAEAEMTAQGVALIEAMNAVRRYTSDHIGPLLADDMEMGTEFIAESVPAFSAREVFESFREGEGQSAFFYKEAASNPTNMRDLADEFELTILNRMRQDRNTTEISDFRTRDGERLFFIARPLAVDSESCLACHGDPANAPGSLITTYGSDQGFGWELDEVIAAQMIYVPADEIFDATLQAFSILIFVFITSFVVAIVLINFLLRRYVIQPIGVLDRLAVSVREDTVQQADIESAALMRIAMREDELGDLASVLSAMVREVVKRTQALQNQVRVLQVEVDEIRKKKQVAEIVEKDYFADLKAKAQQMRETRRRRRPSDGEDAPKMD